jgi:hypothetical protein
MAAVLYAVHPDQGFFQLSDPGAINVDDSGRLKFTPGAGKVRALVVDPAQKQKVIQTYIEVASAKPVRPPQRPKRPDANAKAGAAAEVKEKQ